MALEDLTGSKYIDSLVATNPATTDFRYNGVGHLQGIKNVLKQTFPNITAAITATAAQINVLTSVVAGTIAASKAVVVDASKDISGFNNIKLVGETITFDAEYDNGNSGTADTIDWGNGNKQKSTLTGACTFTFTAPDGPCNVMLRLIQDATGGRTVTWPATVKWPAGTAPVLSTAASAVDLVAFYYDGTNYYGQAGLNYS